MNKLLLKYRRAKIRLICKKLDYYIQKIVRNQDIKVVTVTGTIGKTSAKVAITQLLSNKYDTFIEVENSNSDRTIRLNFFGLQSPDHSRRLIMWLPLLRQAKHLAKNFPYKVVVLEMAESRQKSLESFIASIKPDIAVVTGVSPVHMRYFKTIDKVVEATWSLAKLADHIIYNADFAELTKLASSQINTEGYGLKKGDISIENITRNKKGTLDVNLMIRQKSIRVHTNLIASQSLYALLAATAVAHQLGWTVEQISHFLNTIQPIQGRTNPLDAINDSLIIDDSFNASPITMFASLQTLSEIPGYKIAVLGSMNELGSISRSEHHKVGKRVAEVADILITVGIEAQRYLAPAAIQAGMPVTSVFSFDKSNQTGDCLRSVIKKQSVILFKGSQGGIYIEEAIKFVLQDPQLTSELLVRQKGEWQRRKKDYFSILN